LLGLLSLLLTLLRHLLLALLLLLLALLCLLLSLLLTLLGNLLLALLLLLSALLRLLSNLFSLLLRVGLRLLRPLVSLLALLRCLLLTLLFLLTLLSYLLLVRPCIRLGRVWLWPVSYRIYLNHTVIRCAASGHLCQAGSILVDYCRIILTVGDACIRVFASVSLGVYYPGRVRILRFLNYRAININRIVLNTHGTWPWCVVNPVNLHVVIMRNLPDFLYTRTGNISHIIINVCVVNDGGVMYDIDRTRWRHIIIVNARTGYIGLWRANPVIVRSFITAADGYADTDTRP
jgi:hypothetical protein